MLLKTKTESNGKILIKKIKTILTSGGAGAFF